MKPVWTLVVAAGAILSVVLPVVCAELPALTEAMTELRHPVVTEAENGKAVPVKVGESVEVRLKGNPTTGYLWAVTGLSSNTVEQVGEVEYRRDDAGKRMVGRGGVFVATFKALKPGKTTVRMEYRRPWEKDVTPIETFTVTLDVK
jgi:inhibitor of cysteine peptidase